MRESWRQPSCTYTGLIVLFFCETSLPFCFVLPGSKSFLVHLIFRRPSQSLWSQLLPTRCTWICLPLSCHHAISPISAEEQHTSCLLYKTGALPVMPPTQVMWHFHSVKGIFKSISNTNPFRVILCLEVRELCSIFIDISFVQDFLEVYFYLVLLNTNDF